jgi:hypothetical protein
MEISVPVPAYCLGSDRVFWIYNLAAQGSETGSNTASKSFGSPEPPHSTTPAIVGTNGGSHRNPSLGAPLADSTNVAIGFGAKAETKELKCDNGSICNQDSPVNATQTVNNNYGPRPLDVSPSQQKRIRETTQKFDGLRVVVVLANPIQETREFAAKLVPALGPNATLRFSAFCRTQLLAARRWWSAVSGLGSAREKSHLTFP